jgi:hypothetical protein
MMKRGLVLALFLVLCAMSSIAQEVQSGTFSATSATPGYTLHKDSGDRTLTIEVTFDKPFQVKPDIVISVSLLDVASNSNIRYNVAAKAVSRDGFAISIMTWADSKILGIGGSWLAVSRGK